jgi:undecaprenyl-diphosphatase
VSGLEAFLLGIAQGLTEFFPVSSSGHLVMGEALLGIDQEGILFEIAVHVATLLAVVLFYHKRIAELILGACKGQRDAIEYILKLGVATVPAVFLVIGAGEFMESQFDSPNLTGVCLLITGGMLWSTKYTLPRASGSEISWPGAFLIGCAQAFAILPGISRSGSTVVVALALGVKGSVAAEFSFLMSVIAITGAMLLKLPELLGSSTDAMGNMLIGSVAALVFGLLALFWFVRFLNNQRFHYFAFYAWAVGASFLVWLQVTS